MTVSFGSACSDRGKDKHVERVKKATKKNGDTDAERGEDDPCDLLFDGLTQNV